MMITTLYFGKDDAETDFTSSGLLQGSFLKTAIFDQIKSRAKSLVIGRKGSGKSALCLILKKELNKEEKTYACVVTPDAISADEIKRFQMAGINEQQSKKLIWRYIFLVQICKFLLEASRSHFESDWSTEPEQSPEPDWSNDQSCSSQLKKIREFLVENREVDDLNFQESFWRIINRIQAALTFKAFGQAVEVKASQSTNEGLDFNSKLEFLESYLKKPLDHLQEYKFFLLVDKVDEIWDGSPSSNEMVIGLLMASKEINQMNSNVSCAVFLRTDIYEQLHFFDKDKLRGDEVPVLWNSTTLPEIILERARVSTKQEGMVAQDFWSQYFPSEVEGSKTSDFVVSHTLMRPRDVIQLCNLCADTARREGSDSVQEKHILQALDMYSSWKLNDLLGEYRVNYPFLNDLLIIFSNTSYVLPRVRLEEIYSRINLALEERYPTYRQLLSVDSCLNILYGIGFIGVERVGRVVFYYQDPRTVEDHDDVFIVHPAFRNALKCTSSIDIQPYSPVGGVSNSRRFTRRYLEQEFTRSRSPIRGSFESSVPSTSRFVRFLEQLDYFRRRVVREQQLPAEVVGEISRNLGLMINELTEAIEQDYDVIQLEMCRTNVLRYLEELREKLGNTGFLSGNSSINAELERLLSEKFSS
jgi:hypothetical protein